MFNWTIDGKTYLVPQGYGEITLAQFTAYMATVAPMKPIKKVKVINGNGIIARLTRRMQRKAQELRDDRESESFDWLAQLEFETSFVCHWLKLPAELAAAMEPSDISAIYAFLVKSWQSWKPIDNPNGFTFDGKSWNIDYSLDTLGSIGANDDPQVILSKICSSRGKKMKARGWGGVSLNVAASIFAEIAKRQRAMGVIVGQSILESFKIEA